MAEAEIIRTDIDTRLYSEDEIRGDFQVAEDNRHLFRTRRGRVCEAPDCSAKVRYSKDVPFCSLHEEPRFVEDTPKKGRGRKASPPLPGLKAARKARGLTQKEVSEELGKGKNWAKNVEKEAFGVPPEVRKRLAEILEVPESALVGEEGAA